MASEQFNVEEEIRLLIERTLKAPPGSIVNDFPERSNLPYDMRDKDQYRQEREALMVFFYDTRFDAYPNALQTFVNVWSSMFTEIPDEFRTSVSFLNSPDIAANEKHYQREQEAKRRTQIANTSSAQHTSTDKPSVISPSWSLFLSNYVLQLQISDLKQKVGEFQANIPALIRQMAGLEPEQIMNELMKTVDGYKTRLSELEQRLQQNEARSTNIE